MAGASYLSARSLERSRIYSRSGEYIRSISMGSFQAVLSDSAKRLLPLINLAGTVILELIYDCEYTRMVDAFKNKKYTRNYTKMYTEKNI